MTSRSAWAGDQCSNTFSTLRSNACTIDPLLPTKATEQRLMVAGPPTTGGLVAGDPADPCVLPRKRFCNVNARSFLSGGSIVDRRR